MKFNSKLNPFLQLRHNDRLHTKEKFNFSWNFVPNFIAVKMLLLLYYVENRRNFFHFRQKKNETFLLFLVHRAIALHKHVYTGYADISFSLVLMFWNEKSKEKRSQLWEMYSFFVHRIFMMQYLLFWMWTCRPDGFWSLVWFKILTFIEKFTCE